MIPVRIKKVAGDLLTRWGRTLLTLVGLSLGLYGLCSVLVAFVLLADDLNENYRATNPANIVVTVQDVDEALLARIASIENVGDVERRDIVRGRIDAGDGAWMPVTIFVVEDFERLRVASFYPERGAWPPPTGDILLERDGGFFLRAADSPLRLRIGRSPQIDTRLAGWTYDPGQAPSRMEMALYGYASRATLERWGVAPESARILVTVPSNANAGVNSSARRAARAIETTLTEAGANVLRTEIFDSPRHPHQFQLNAMIAILAGIGVVSLMLCVVLVVNLIDALMASEQRAIGVMRAIGAVKGQIERDYLLGVGALGLVACMIATPLAVSLGRGLALFVSRMLNFDLLSEAGPPWLIVGVLAVGVLLPMLVAMVRVRRAAGMPVREALARIDPSQIGPIAQRIGEIFTPLPLTLRAAARALVARPRRALFTAGALTLGLLFFLVALNIRTSLWETVESVGRTKPFDLVVRLREAEEVSRLDAWAANTRVVVRSEYWSGGEGVLYAAGLQVSNPSAFLAVPEQSWALRPELIEGAWLDPRVRPNGVVVTQRFLGDHNLVQVGQSYDLRLGGRMARVTIVGVVREFGPGVAYVTRNLFERLRGESARANLAFFDLGANGDAFSERYVASLMEANAPEAGVSIASVGTSGLLELIVINHLEGIALVLEIIAAIALAVGAVGLASSISVSVVERYREIGVLKALGGRAGAVGAVFVTEAILIALFGWLAAVAVAPWLSREISAAFGTVIIEYPFDYRAFPWGWTLALGAALAIAVLASLLPVRSAINTSIYRALRSE